LARPARRCARAQFYGVIVRAVAGEPGRFNNYLIFQHDEGSFGGQTTAIRVATKGGMMNARSWARMAILLIGLLAVGGVRADAVTDDARALLDAGDAEAAYALLEPLEAQRAGDPDFDFLLGLAALESGRSTEAVFALERVLAVRPGDLRARVEIARAYASVGETTAAKREFEAVKDAGVPPEVAATINRLLSAVERVEDVGRTTVSGYLDAAIGYDSNVNSATGAQDIAVPLFGGAIFRLVPTGVETSDSFFAIGGGVGVRHPVDPDWAVTAGLSAYRRFNSDLDIFDTGFVDANLGVARAYYNEIFSGALQYNQFRVDNDRYRNATGAVLQWQHWFHSRSQGSLYLQYANLEYPSQEPRDADRVVLGANVAHALIGLRTVLFGGVYVGDERTDDRDFSYLGHRALGARAGAQYELRPDTTVFGTVGFENRSYDGEDPYFLTERDDDNWTVGVGIAWTPYEKWVVTPRYDYISNRSNIELQEYSRSVFSVTVRREF
jgi:tetratricopeptide (TPR) repeat protein